MITAYFIDLVEYHHRVTRFYLAQGLQDASRHGADIGFPVPANLTLVVQTAQAHPHVFAVYCGSNAFTQTGFTNAGGAEKTKYGRFHIAFQF